MTRKEAEKLVLDAFDGRVERSTKKYIAGSRAYWFVYDTLDNGDKKIMYITGLITRLIDKLEEYERYTDR